MWRQFWQRGAHPGNDLKGGSLAVLQNDLQHSSMAVVPHDIGLKTGAVVNVSDIAQVDHRAVDDLHRHVIEFFHRFRAACSAQRRISRSPILEVPSGRTTFWAFTAFTTSLPEISLCREFLRIQIDADQPVLAA